MAVMSQKRRDMIQFMVAHVHTVIRLYHRVPDQLAWLEYDVQYRMEIAASEERKWLSGDPWRYVPVMSTRTQFNQ